MRKKNTFNICENIFQIPNSCFRLVDLYNLHIQISSKQLMGFWGEEKNRCNSEENERWVRDDNFDREVCKREYLYFKSDDLWTVLFASSIMCYVHSIWTVLRHSHSVDLSFSQKRKAGDRKRKRTFRKQNKTKQRHCKIFFWLLRALIIHNSVCILCTLHRYTTIRSIFLQICMCKVRAYKIQKAFRCSTHAKRTKPEENNKKKRDLRT